MDYQALTKTQKIAAFLIVIGPEAAVEVMRHFDNDELEAICREMAAMEMIDHDVQQRLTEELSDVITGGLLSVFGGLSYAQAALEKVKGDYAATAILNRVMPTGHAGEAGEDIRQMDGLQILNLVKSEQPQTIAFILSYLYPVKAAGIIQMLPQEIRDEVVERLGGMEETSADIVNKIARNLMRHVDKTIVQQSVHHSGGVKPAAEILNLLDKETRNAMLTKIDGRNASLGSAIRKAIFGFDDLVRLSSADLQRVLREVESPDLATALKSAKPVLRNAILGAMSKRAAEGLKEEIEMMSPPKPKAVEAVQTKIMQIVRKLEEAEEITLETGGDERAAA